VPAAICAVLAEVGDIVRMKTAGENDGRRRPVGWSGGVVWVVALLLGSVGQYMVISNVMQRVVG
jgi:hypothetical protein